MTAEEDVTLVSTDEAILNSIGEGDESTTSESISDEDTGTTTDAPTETFTASSEQGIEGQPPTEQQRSSAGPQDLIDKDGNVIAAGGKERRFYETAQRERARAEQASNEVETLKSQLEAINNAGNIGTQYNLTPEEVTTGAQIIAAYKENPVETLNYMLTQAQASGHNVDGIINGGTDLAAIQQLIKNELAPITEEQQRRADTQEAEGRATEIYNGFMSQHPDAAVHENALARLLQEDNSLTVDAAYYKLQNFYLQRGLDWTKPLEVLNREAEAQKTANVNTPPQPPEGNSVSPSNVTDTAQVADVSTSTDDIIKQAMNEAGITI